MRIINLFLLLIIVFLVAGCTHTSLRTTEIRHIPIDSLNDIIGTEYVDFDATVTSDGNGSIKIICDEPTVVELYILDDIDIEHARLIYEAKLRSENLKGMAYLEMYCCFDDLGEYFSRGLQSPITGTSSWRMKQTPFFLEDGQHPDRIKLNIVVDGVGTVWIDDIHLSKAPLG